MDVLDLFEDSLESLFGYHQTARGDAGQLIDFIHPHLPPWLPLAPSETSNPVEHAKCSDPTTNGTRRLPYRIPTTAEASNNRLFAHHQWDAGSHLAALILEASCHPLPVDDVNPVTSSPFDTRGKDVVELGAGTGLPSLVAAVCRTQMPPRTGGSHSIVITDYPDPSIVQCLKDNIRSLSQLAKEAGAAAHNQEIWERVHGMGLEWGNEMQAREVLSLSSNPSPSKSFDLVLLADCLWLSSSHGILLSTIRRLLRRDSKARAIVVAGFHSGRRAVERFFDRAAGEAEDEDGGYGISVGDREGKSKAEGRGDGASMEQLIPLVPDPTAPFGGIWKVHTSGIKRPWRTGSSDSAPSSSTEAAAAAAEEEEKEQRVEDEDDMHNRSHCMVVAILRWQDLIEPSLSPNQRTGVAS